jgi:hypothetical protein
MPIEYESRPTNSSLASHRICLLFLKLLIAYLVISIVTLPFLNAFWIGELPVFALIQVPKIELALFVRVHIVMEALKPLGLSRGSFSPDYIRAGPYALVITYLSLLLLIVAGVWRLTRMRAPFLRLTLILIALAIVDFFCVLFFSRGPSLTIY